MDDSRRRQARRAIAAILVVGLGAAAGAWWAGNREARHRPETDRAPTWVELTPNLVLERAIAPGETQLYRLGAAEEERFLSVVIEQQGIDVATTVRDGSGRTILVADRPIADSGPEPLLLLAGAGAALHFEVFAEGSPGRYRLSVQALRPAGEEDRQRARAALAFFEGDRRRRAGRSPAAEAQYRVALEMWSAIGDAFWQADVLDRLGKVQYSQGRFAEAVETHQRSAELARRIGDPRLEAMGLTQAGTSHFLLGELDEAIDHWQRALPLQERLDDRQLRAITLHDLAHAYQVKDRLQESLDHYEAAIEAWREGDPNRAASVHNLGVLYHRLGRPERARDLLEAALRVWLQQKDRQRQAATLSRLAEVWLDLGRIDEALLHHDRALVLRRAVGDARGEAATLAGLAQVHEAQGETDRALHAYLRALDVLRDINRPRSEARVHLRLGLLYNRLRRPEPALASFQAALATYRRTGDRVNEAESLLGIAAAYRQSGDSRSALGNAAPALEILESVRPSAISKDLRADFFSTVQHHFDSYVDLLMELEEIEPGAGHLAVAFQASERSRARSLVDLLQEAGGDIRQGAEPALLAREQELQERINEKDRQRVGLLQEEDYSQRLVAAVEKQLRDLLEDLERVRAEIRARSPRYAALTQPEPLTLEETQSQVVDAESLLLEFRLGRRASYLWLVSRNSAAGFALPPREEIEQAALGAYELLRRSLSWESRASTQLALCELSRKVLGPVAGMLDRERLLIVSDGALDYIPFAALPQPSALGDCRSAPLLVEEHEITYLPSASAAVMLRYELAVQRPAAGTIAVIADPIFAAGDERLVRPLDRPEDEKTRASSNLEDTVAERPAMSSSFQRLPYSRREAEVILGLVPNGERTLALLDLEANKEAVTGGALSGFRILHFATHGVLNAAQPELSGIVLSMVDAGGGQRDGFLRAHEIYNLDLPSELVVLSACRTALGKEVRGEGLVGLTRGFMYAGAARVMVSLWSVSDRSTAALMEEFYRGLFKEGLRPSAALRRAQLAMLRERRWSTPYHWAGFVLQGEWR